ncbi:hypothetical protein EZS27_033285 [termite gut metagenome]|uniref:Pesticidal crystal protein Cry22Aa Ig-like domain-containing protein n=1 Tax=termite gut metagenome TaxID=433724 RepID=A0A5J4Q5Y7_9ZZZZ
MMKKILYSLSLCLAFVFISCEEDTTQDTSKVTHYVNFEMKGEQTVLVSVGTPYVDEGVVAIEGENDITSSVITAGSVDSSTIGLYYINYKAQNADGYSSSIERTIIVYDPDVTTNLAGTYTTAEGSYRYWLATDVKVLFSGYKIDVSLIAPGIFYISDYMGGYYDQRVGYGSAYAMKGYFKLNVDNTLDALSGDVAGWGDSFDSFENGEYDPASGSLYWELGYGGSMVFYITLNK